MEKNEKKISEKMSPKETLEKIRANGAELTDEQLEKASGGMGWVIPDCPKCGSDNTQGYKYEFKCKDCGYIWTT